MQRILPFTVLPSLPEQLEPLRGLAYNLWWTWQPSVRTLFRRIDADLWEDTNSNPVEVLGRVSQARLRELLEDEGFLAHMNQVADALDAYLGDTTYFDRHFPDYRDLRIAYFSFEFGLSEALRIYSGGLGVLSGDHLKSASDLGLPLVGVGLFYSEGYFRQYLNADGWQQETANENDPFQLPITLVRDDEGEPVVIRTHLPDIGDVALQVWKAEVGRISLYLLDANVQENAQEVRAITYTLYGGDRLNRIRQEVLLGIGGVRALEALGIRPDVCHMNEGHSAFLGLERVRALCEDGLPYQVALELASAGNVFTTHTPVPAGNDRFQPDRVVKHFENWIQKVGIKPEELIALGREEPSNHAEPFCMTVLALKTSNHANAVSELHADVSSAMWKRIWPSTPVAEVPIFPITNGIHLESFIASDIARIFDMYLGPRWRTHPYEKDVWERFEQVPDEELWQAHERRRRGLVNLARKRLARQLVRRGGGPREVELAHQVLDPGALTIGFARRFATYKRATLLFRDLERLVRIVDNPAAPVQLVFAGKAHPHDHEGKALIRDIIHATYSAGLRRHVVFIEDYDLAVARRLVQGVDVWLNTPRRPLEASGTSGMKAVANGAIHCSTLDGWWAECYEPELGFCIGRGEEYEDTAHGDDVEAKDLYNMLEQTIVPLFYERRRNNLPIGWLRMVKRSIASLVPFFNTHRMLLDYLEKSYIPAARKVRALSNDQFQAATTLAAWKKRVTRSWHGVAVPNMWADQATVSVGEPLVVQADVNVGELDRTDVRVEVFFGTLNSKGEIVDSRSVAMEWVENVNGHARYKAVVPADVSGRHGFTIRVFPHHELMSQPGELRLIRWA